MNIATEKQGVARFHPDYVEQLKAGPALPREIRQALIVMIRHTHYDTFASGEEISLAAFASDWLETAP